MYNSRTSLRKSCPLPELFSFSQHFVRREAERVLKKQSEASVAEIQYLLEYYSLVRGGKTNYISTQAFHDITGQHVQEPVEWFKLYKEEFVGKEEHARKKRKADEH
jgi:hypothetical protein